MKEFLQKHKAIIKTILISVFTFYFLFLQSCACFFYKYYKAQEDCNAIKEFFEAIPKLKNK